MKVTQDREEWRTTEPKDGRKGKHYLIETTNGRIVSGLGPLTGQIVNRHIASTPRTPSSQSTPQTSTQLIRQAATTSPTPTPQTTEQTTPQPVVPPTPQTGSSSPNQPTATSAPQSVAQPNEHSDILNRTQSSINFSGTQRAQNIIPFQELNMGDSDSLASNLVKNFGRSLKSKPQNPLMAAWDAHNNIETDIDTKANQSQSASNEIDKRQYRMSANYYYLKAAKAFSKIVDNKVRQGTLDEGANTMAKELAHYFLQAYNRDRIWLRQHSQSVTQPPQPIQHREPSTTGQSRNTKPTTSASVTQDYHNQMFKKEKFGMEIEFGNIPRREVVAVIRKALGGISETKLESPGYDDPHGRSLEAQYVIDKYGRKWGVMNDASITLMQGNELVTPPLTLDHDIDLLKSIVKELKNRGAKTNSSCGIHVHTDGPTGTEQEKAKALAQIVTWISNKQDELYDTLKITKSPYMDENKYRRKLPIGFAARINSFDFSKKNILDIIKGANYMILGGAHSGPGFHYDSSRYHLVNLHSFFETGKKHPTVELRMFNSTLDDNKIESYAQFAMGLATAAKTNKEVTYYKKGNDWLEQIGMSKEAIKHFAN